MMKRTMGGVLAAAMMMMSALPAAGAVDVSHLNGAGSCRYAPVSVRCTDDRAGDRCQL